MKAKLLPSLIFFVSLLYIASCSKSGTNFPDPCASINYTVTHSKTESIGTSNNGTITITEPRGDTISYKLNSGSYQSSWHFTNLAPGNYVVTVKNQHNCTDTAQITILNYGPKFAAVKQLILGYCGPCHLNGTVNGSMNFDTDASIVTNKLRIKARAVDGIPTFMPETPNSPLSLVDRQKITDWINAGGTTMN